MPYICLARNDLPDGAVQVLDLQPNSSQGVPALQPPGQTRYVNRAKSTQMDLGATGYLVQDHVDGLSAYLLDRVECGALEVAEGLVTVNSAVRLDELIIGGVTFTAVENFATATIDFNGVGLGDTFTIGATAIAFAGAAAENIAARQFNASAGDAAAVASFLNVFNDAANQALIAAANAGRSATAAATSVGGGQILLTATLRGIPLLATTESTVGARIVLTPFALTMANPAAQEFDGSSMVADNAAVAASLVTTITDPASIVLMRAANTDVYADATDALNAITLSAMYDDGVNPPVPQVGLPGELTLAVAGVTPGVTARLVLSGTQLVRDAATWTNGLVSTVVTDILTRVDTGLPLTLGDINTILLADVGADLTGAGVSQSTGTVADLLSILAGRVYRVYQRNPLTGVYNRFFTAPGVWNPATLGGFTQPVLTNGVWQDGEIKPLTIGGDIENREIAGIRHTYGGDSLTLSLACGTLAVFCAVPGMPPVTLFPDSDLLPFFPWTYQKALTYPQVDNARVLTVYDDDGSILA